MAGENELARHRQAFQDRAVVRLLPLKSAPLEVVSREIGVGVDTLVSGQAGLYAIDP